MEVRNGTYFGGYRLIETFRHFVRVVALQNGVQTRRRRRDSFMSQGDHGIDAHRAPGRDEACQKRDHN